MGQREADINHSSTNLPEYDPQSPQYDAEKFKARLIQVYERGVVADRLAVNLPPDLYGEWVPNDEFEVERKRALGFWIDQEHAPKRALHAAGDGTAKVGDVIFMVTRKEIKDVIDKINHDKYIQTHDPRRVKEAIEFKNRLRKQAQDTGVVLPEVDESNTTAVGAQAILDGVKSSLEGGVNGDRLDKPAPSPNQVVFK